MLVLGAELALPALTHGGRVGQGVRGCGLEALRKVLPKQGESRRACIHAGSSSTRVCRAESTPRDREGRARPNLDGVDDDLVRCKAGQGVAAGGAQANESRALQKVPDEAPRRPGQAEQCRQKVQNRC